MKITEIHEAKYQAWINRSNSHKSLPQLKKRFKRKPFNWECYEHRYYYQNCVEDIFNTRGYTENIPFNDEINRRKLPNMDYHKSHNKLMYKFEIGKYLNDGQNGFKAMKMVLTYYFKYKQ